MAPMIAPPAPPNKKPAVPVIKATATCTLLSAGVATILPRKSEQKALPSGRTTTFLLHSCHNHTMPSRASRPKRPRDTNQLAWAVVQEATGQAPPERPEPPDTRNPAAVALSALGAAKGRKARAAKLSPAKRKAISKKAAKARWGHHLVRKSRFP